jgi:hypothetical protein
MNNSINKGERSDVMEQFVTLNSEEEEEEGESKDLKEQQQQQQFTLPILTHFQLFSLSVFWFGVNVMSGAFSAVIVPSQVNDISGIAQLANCVNFFPLLISTS